VIAVYDPVCPRGGVHDLMLHFGGRKPAHLLCSKCRTRFDLEGNVIEDHAREVKA